MSGILILSGVELEARVLARQLELPALKSLPFTAFGRDSVRLAPVGLRAGFLPSRWARLTEGLDHPLVVSAGVCGGLDPQLHCGDLVLPESVIGPSGELFNVTPSQHRRAAGLAGEAARGGALVTAREVVATPEAKAALFAGSGAVAVDMESAQILARSTAAGCPALVVRAISDGADESVPPELVGLVSAAGRLRTVRALALTVTRPTVLPRALALRQATQHALGVAARLLAVLIG